MKQNSENKENILRRLRRIEGQIKGIQKMLENEYCCVDILTQIAAVRAAVDKVGVMILKNYSLNCIKEMIESEDKEKIADNLTRTLESFLKFVD